ncbi:membrane dipeptidase [Streptomyces sp. NBC_01003]|uniref:membrane dipeptidase n=1 Tax=Streptomyces sp. NBC_01003 TaxID=2903714 RepID=UPI003865D8B1|nr:membrane dipeptidase [Streptomyces sp. NBC_01003]
MVRHIDYAVDLVGPEHVGISSDYPFDHEDFNAMVTQNPKLFPTAARAGGRSISCPRKGC